MCLFPLQIRNPTKKISRQGGQLLQMSVPCGKCAECIKAKRNEWYFRSYHHVEDCINNGGYVYYTTLTYAPEHLPMLSHFVDTQKLGVEDFSCFNHTHFRNFLKNLRRQLQYHYKNVNFTYFLTSEYGTDDNYTHRPHYHILFYIHGDIHPLAFSRFVDKVWSYGRTDGITYKPFLYVANHVYGYDLGLESGKNDSFLAKSCVTNYVSKYISKDSEFQHEIDRRIKSIKEVIEDDDELRTLVRNISQFHRQSQGYGIAFLDNLANDEDNMKFIEDDVVVIKDSEKVVNTLPLPMYYKRHMYYIQKKRPDNTRYWELTELGAKHKIDKMIKSVDDLVERYRTIYLNTNDDNRYMLDKLLGSRSAEDFAIYKLFYQGRLRDKSSYDVFSTTQNYELNKVELGLSSWLGRIFDSFFVNEQENDDIFVQDVNVVQVPRFRFQDDLFVSVPTDNVSYHEFIKHYTFNENSCIEFRNFDCLDKLYKKIEDEQNQLKQQTFEYEEELKRRLRRKKGDD